MSQAEVLASHWVLLFFLGLLNKYLLVWSMDYASVERPRQDYIRRMWSEWTVWSACSRTCGGGVKMRTRVCKISRGYSVATLSNSCIGETIEYELCSVHNCSPQDKEFLEYQCSLRDGQTVRGSIVEEWIPYRYGRNPCELQCWSKDRTLVYSFGKAIDGTKCATTDPRQPALCINGRCTPVDCAGQIGSDNKMDRCGVCRGNNSTCIYYKDAFWSRPRIKSHFEESRDHHYDYEKITTIPAGATEIIITENSQTNFLALLDHKNNYLVNGNWRIQSPGRFVMHGSEFTYNRTWDGKESLSIQGPTRFDVHVHVLGSGDIPTVNFEYWISSDNPFKTTQTFQTLNMIKHADSSDNKHTEFKYLYPENNHIHDESPKKHFTPVTKFQGYKSYYHRNEILKSVPSWSIKRHSTHKSNVNRYVDVQNDISSTTVENSVELNTKVTPYSQVEAPSESRNKVDTKTFVLNKPKTVPENNKMYIHSSNSREYPAFNQQEAIFIRRDNIYLNESITPNNRQKNNNMRRRYSVNTIPSTRTRKCENFEHSTDEYGRLTTAMVQARNNNFYQGELLVSPQPNVLLSASESNVNNKRPNRRQKSSKNHKNVDGDKKQKLSKKKRKSGNDTCQPCQKSKQQKKNFCTNDFVLRVVVLSIERLDDSFRYELQISQSYKNKVHISPREYIWTKELCRCPKLHVGHEYVIMGHSGTSGNRRESRLLMNKDSFARKYTMKRARTLQRLVRDQKRICKKYEANRF